MTARAPLPVPPGNRLAFNIIRKGSVIGQHALTFTPSGDNLTVGIAVDIRVGLGPIALVRYTHRATERWEMGQVVSIESQTDDDGASLRMAGRREENGLVVEGSKAPRYTAPPHTLPGTHWNRAMLDGPIINTENGKLMQPAVTAIGLQKVTFPGGSVEAQAYKLRGDVNLDTWYDDRPAWFGLRFVAHDGSDILYERV
jgi:hypothetical protein